MAAPEIDGRAYPKQVAAPKRFRWPRSAEMKRWPRPKYAMLKASRDFDKMLDQGDANPQAQVEELEKLRQEDVGPPSNPERFSKLVDEMSYSEVVEILGKPGVKVSEDTLNEGKIRLEMYFWEGDDGAFAIAMFWNGALTSNRNWIASNQALRSENGIPGAPEK